jgi:hypothetical protein
MTYLICFDMVASNWGDLSSTFAVYDIKMEWDGWGGAYSILMIPVFKIWGSSLLCSCLDDLLLRLIHFVVKASSRHVYLQYY